MYKNEKGSSLLTVLISTAVLIILGAAIADSVVQRYKIAKSQEHIEYTYIAGETAVERTFYLVDRICRISTLTSGLMYDGDDAVYSDSVISLLENNLDSVIPGLVFNDIEVLDDSTFKARSGISLQRMGQQRTADGMSMTITVGVTAITSLTRGIYSSLERKVFAQREFTVPIAISFKLNEAICSIGDLIADNAVNATITGDVNVYGTSPLLKNQPQQEFYGGIYAKHDSSLKIDGNAYTRSFIRTGVYNDFNGGSIQNDTSIIHVLKDAVAQSVQIFGKGNKIVVNRNVYTFDDVEIDGEDSVIAINGSIFALSSGGEFHDQSSAVINAAPIHFSYSEDSMKSRIVVNGDLLINGETLKIDPLGGALYKMENASMAWAIDDNIAAYKKYAAEQEEYDLVNGITDGYLTWLKNLWDAYGNGTNVLRGFLNLFQTFPVKAAGEIDAWLTDIDDSRRVGFNTVTGPDYLYGFSNSSMAANDYIYFMDKINQDNSGIRRLNEIIKDTFEFDNADVTKLYPIVNTWSGFWKTAMYKDDGDPNDGDVFDGGETTWEEYQTLIKSKLDLINPFLQGLTHKLVARDYSEGDNIKHAPLGAPFEINGIAPDNLFLFLQTALNYKYPVEDLIAEPYVIKYEENSSDDPENIPNQGTADNNYYLVINNNPEKVLKVTGKFNGIIFSMGRVDIGKGANITGSIVAAGRGYDPEPGNNYVSGSSAEYYTDPVSSIKTPRVPTINGDGSNMEHMENAGYAAVYFDGNLGNGVPGAGNPVIAFPGREALIAAFESQGIYLSSIF